MIFQEIGDLKIEMEIILFIFKCSKGELIYRIDDNKLKQLIFHEIKRL